MKISPRATALALTAAALLAISACGGSDSPTETEITTPKTKNAALPITTLPATTVVKATTTSIAKTVTTPMPRLGVANGAQRNGSQSTPGRK